MYIVYCQLTFHSFQVFNNNLLSTNHDATRNRRKGQGKETLAGDSRHRCFSSPRYVFILDYSYFYIVFTIFIRFNDLDVSTIITYPMRLTTIKTAANTTLMCQTTVTTAGARDASHLEPQVSFFGSFSTNDYLKIDYVYERKKRQQGLETWTHLEPQVLFSSFFLL